MNAITPNTAGRSGQLLKQFNRNNDRVAKSLERLSTGKRINRPGDDPAGFVAAEQLRGDIVDLHAQSRAAAGGRFEVRIRESALSEVQATLHGIRGNLVSAASPLNSATESRALQQEIDASLDAIGQIADRVEGVADSTSLKELRETGSANVINGDISAATELVEGQLGGLSHSRAAAGAYQKTQTLFEQMRKDQIAISTEALSQIEDADFAQETSNLVQGQILSKASINALTFANRESLEQIQALLEGLEEE